MEVQGRPRGALWWPQDWREDPHTLEKPSGQEPRLACLQGDPASHLQAALPILWSLFPLNMPA